MEQNLGLPTEAEMAQFLGSLGISAHAPATEPVFEGVNKRVTVSRVQSVSIGVSHKSQAIRHATHGGVMAVPSSIRVGNKSEAIAK